jgi:hypothetical protein
MFIITNYLFTILYLSMLLLGGKCSIINHVRAYWCELGGGCEPGNAVGPVSHQTGIMRANDHIDRYEQKGGCYKRVMDKLQPNCYELVDDENIREEC